MLKKISDIGIVPVIKINDVEKAVPLAKALIDGGLPIAEIKFRTEAAEEAIKRVSEAFPEMLVGAGTVLTIEQAERAKNAGAKFIVTPGLDIEIVKYCQEKGIEIYAGCTTPTDYHAAYNLGLKVLKFFPAEQSGGLAKIKAMSAPFPMFKIMPTGGISLNNLAQYAASPVIIACGGSYTCPDKLIREGKWDEITQLCKKSVEIVREARK